MFDAAKTDARMVELASRVWSVTGITQVPGRRTEEELC